MEHSNIKKLRYGIGQMIKGKIKKGTNERTEKEHLLQYEIKTDVFK
jgi:hypothetical protein